MKKDDNTPDLFGAPDAPLVLVENTKEDPARVIEFLLAGKSKFTLKSRVTGFHFTYKITRGEGQLWFVSRLTIKGEYIYQGTIFPEGFRKTQKTKYVTEHSKGFAAFKWFWEKISVKGELPKGVEVYHMGRCAACGLELTDPLSVETGYGPTCRKRQLSHSFMYGNKTS